MDSAPEGGPPRARRRDYETVLSALEAKWKRHPPDRARRMHEIINALWDTFGGKAYSWVGFYFPTADRKELTLGPNRDHPACSPIGAHGVCGKAVSTKETQIVADVKALGGAYVECDPRDRSEIVVPVIGDDGAVFAVLDIDSHEPDFFNDDDRRWLERIVKGLAHSPAPRQSHLAWVGAALGLLASSALASMLTLTTIYPAPSGVYKNLVTTQQTTLARDNGGWLGIGFAGAPSAGIKFQVQGYSYLTDPTGSYNSHFPYSDNNAYLTGQAVYIRGGTPQGSRTYLYADKSQIWTQSFDASWNLTSNNYLSGYPGWAGYFQGVNGTTHGLYAYTNATSGGYVGLQARSDDPQGEGVMAGSYNRSVSSWRSLAYLGTGWGWAAYIQGLNGTTHGIYGFSNATSGGYLGIEGETRDPSGAGVFGGSSDGTTWRSYAYVGHGNGNAIHAYGNGYFSGSVTASSDGRLKENVRPIEASLKTVLALRPVSFDWKKDTLEYRSNHGRQFGFIGQEVETVIPEIVHDVEAPKVPDSKGRLHPTSSLGTFKTMEYTRIIPFLTGAVQELDREFDAKIRALEEENRRLKERLAAIESALKR